MRYAGWSLMSVQCISDTGGEALVARSCVQEGAFIAHMINSASRALGLDFNGVWQTVST